MNDLLEIKVRANTSPGGLAASITNAFKEGRDVELVAIGPVPVSQAVKAVVDANRFLASSKAYLVIVPRIERRLIHDKTTHERVPWVVTILQLVDLMRLTDAVAQATPGTNPVEGYGLHPEEAEPPREDSEGPR